jgi:hypothetical protein
MLDAYSLKKGKEMSLTIPSIQQQRHQPRHKIQRLQQDYHVSSSSSCSCSSCSSSSSTGISTLVFVLFLLLLQQQTLPTSSNLPTAQAWQYKPISTKIQPKLYLLANVWKEGTPIDDHNNNNVDAGNHQHVVDNSHHQDINAAWRFASLHGSSFKRQNILDGGLGSTSHSPIHQYIHQYAITADGMPSIPPREWKTGSSNGGTPDTLQHLHQHQQANEEIKVSSSSTSSSITSTSTVSHHQHGQNNPRPKLHQGIYQLTNEEEYRYVLFFPLYDESDLDMVIIDLFSSPFYLFPLIFLLSILLLHDVI